MGDNTPQYSLITIIKMTTSLHELVPCEQIQIEEYETISTDFVRLILGLSPEECFLSDESDLDDFSLMGTSLDIGELSWDEFVISKVRERYGIDLVTTRINLVTLFATIKQTRNKTLH